LTAASCSKLMASSVSEERNRGLSVSALQNGAAEVDGV
jgi:hypothetical protein